jgi:2-C-methyl-D-erythritol 4-phosphate cytidylyltransferase
MSQTPQTFHKDKLLDAYKKNSDVNVTDECTLMELSGYSIKIINGDSENFKITNKLDWEIAKIKVDRE